MNLENLVNFFSWIGAFILFFRALPQAFKSWKDGHSDGLSPSMLWLWLIGSCFILPHLLYQQDWATSIIYFSNVFAVFIMIWFLYYPQKNKEE
jgi:uncharacterized protein with PQ loop repeat